MELLTFFILDCGDELLRLANYIEKSKGLQLVGSAHDASSALEKILKMHYSPSVIILNIDNPNLLNGELQLFIDLNKVITIYMSGLPNSAFRAYEQGALDYLLRPLSYSRFLKMVDRVLNYNPCQLSFEGAMTSFYVQCETKGTLIKVIYNDIFFIEACLNYVKIHLECKCFITYLTLKELEDWLPVNQFVRIHKSFIVNEDKIQAIRADCVLLGDNIRVKIGVNYKNLLFERIAKNTYKRRRCVVVKEVS